MKKHTYANLHTELEDIFDRHQSYDRLLLAKMSEGLTIAGEMVYWHDIWIDLIIYQ